MICRGLDVKLAAGNCKLKIVNRKFVIEELMEPLSGLAVFGFG
jgi:hypothetical protein